MRASSRAAIGCARRTARSGAFALLLLVAGAAGCDIDQAHGAPAQGSRGDAAVADGSARTPALKQKEARRDAESVESDPMIGLTRAQLRTRRGPPTQTRGKEWIYTADQPGCREIIVSEVVTFKKDVVSSVRLERSRTNKVCRRAP